MKVFMIISLLCMFIGCSTKGIIQEDPSGNVYVPKILTPSNFITCKKVAYCKYADIWGKCIKEVEPEQVHFEISCYDLSRDDDPFFIPTDTWKAEFEHEFSLYRNEDVFKLLTDIKYIREHTSLYKNEIPKMVEKFKEFHK